MLISDWIMYQPTVIVRRECHDRVGLYKSIFAEDYEMFLRISYYWKVGVVDQPLAKYRKHSSNITKQIPYRKEFLQDIRGFACKILDEVQLKGLFPNIDYTSDPYCESCAYAIRGAAYLHFDIFDKADLDFGKAIEVNPDNTIPFIWLGISARRQEKFNSADGYLSKILNKILKDNVLYPIAQNASDLITIIQKNMDKDSTLLKNEKIKEYKKLFKITYDGVSGKLLKEKASHKASITGLKPSQYNIIINDYPEIGQNVMFNTFSHAIIVAGDDIKDSILNHAHIAETDFIEDIGTIKKMNILVAQDIDETTIARRWYSIFKDNMIKMHVTILTTYDCNFKCTYCIEEGVKKPIYMSEECADALVDWLIDKAKQNNTKEIALSFYGGEPLLNLMPIYRILDKIQRFAVKHGVIISSAIVTNGSLLSGELLNDLIRYGLVSVKVTLDGEREIHNIRRPFKSGKDSFDTILKNIQEIPDTIKLILQVNVDSENVENFPSLLSFLEETGLKNKVEALVISPVFQSIGSVSSFAGQELGCTKASELYMNDDLIHLEELIARRGFKSRSSSINYKICSMNRNGVMVIIDPMGVIYACPAFVGRESFAIGDIYHDEIDRSKELTSEQLEPCFQCTYFPICGGGCRYNAYIMYGLYFRRND